MFSQFQIVVFLTIWSAMFTLVAASMWRVFAKAGRPGWGALVPFYNLYLIVRIAGRPGWWTAAIFIPVIGWFVVVKVIVEFAARFGKGQYFAVGLLVANVVFWPILAFGRAQYQQPVRGFAVIFTDGATPASPDAATAGDGERQ